MSTLAVPALWEVVKNDFKTLFPEDVYRLWFEPLVCLSTTENAMILGAPTDFAAIWIHDNYLDLITQRLHLSTGHAITVTLKKNPAAPGAHVAPAESAASRFDAAVGAAPAARRPARVTFDERIQFASLNPRNTFENYVMGANNEMAHGAALGVVQAPGQAYNPLFIHGGTGLGKTHLMHAIGHAILRANPHAKVAYLTTEKFTNEYVQALKDNAVTAFRRRYRNVDVFLLDDVQFLSGKEGIQEEFFHTFNELHNAGRQIVLTSDRRASEIKDLEERLVSRFEWGLPADIQPPGYETRLAILRSKAAQLRCDLAPEILDYIAKNISKNIRTLEGALLKVASAAFLLKTPIDLETARKLLEPFIIEEGKNQLTIETIQKRVTEHFQLRPGDMTSKRRPQNIAFPRQIAMYLCRLLTKHSLQEIGEAFGGRDHGTVIHACKTVENIMEQDSSAKASVEYLRGQLAR